MVRLDRTAVNAVRALIAAQPATEAKVAFAWAIAAGQTLAQAATVTWSDGRLRVEARTVEWRREILRAQPMLARRLEDILGPGVVRAIDIPVIADADAARDARRSR
jgi:hypothetical protein